jgi:predicted nucleotidyltransferase
MNTSDLTYREYSFADHKEVYLKLDEAFRQFDAHYYLIGANARDVQLYRSGKKPNRGTADIDFAVMLPSMEVYDELREHLKTIGFEETYGKMPYRLFYPASNTVIDLLPYGEFAQENTIHFKERDIELSIVGFQEVGTSIEKFEHPEGITIPVSPAHGIVILKLISWSEKPARTKDLLDIHALLEGAWELYQDEVVTSDSQYADLLEIDPFDIHLTAARIMGRKMHPILAQSEQLKTKIHTALSKKEIQGANTAKQMAVEMNKTVEEIEVILDAILLGITDEL